MASIPQPVTIFAGQLITADTLNANIVNMISFLKSPPRCVTSASAQAIATGTTGVAIAFVNESVDSDGMHSTVTNPSRITFNTPGLYVVSGQVAWDVNSTGVRGAYVRLKGTTNILGGSQSADTENSVVNVLGYYYFNEGDYIELLGIQSSGANLNTSTNNGGTTLSAVWVGE